MIATTRAAADEAFRYARAVPADKVEWKPLDAGRSVLDICRELALCPGWAVDIIDSKELPEWNEDSMAAVQRQMDQMTTLAECETECNRQLERLFELFRNMPDERLAEKKWLPYDGGRDFTMPEMMGYPKWNFTYHLGQIAYIQLLYGDKEMH